MAHRWIWRLLLVLLPGIILAALLARPSGPTEAPAILLAAPAK